MSNWYSNCEDFEKDVQMPGCVYIYKDQNCANNGFSCHTLWKQRLDMEKAGYKDF